MLNVLAVVGLQQVDVRTVQNYHWRIWKAIRVWRFEVFLDGLPRLVLYEKCLVVKTLLTVTHYQVNQPLLSRILLRLLY